jgi:hypothetical protein
MPVPHTVVWATCVLGLAVAALVPVARRLPDENVTRIVRELDQKVVAFAVKAERVMLCFPGGKKITTVSKESEETFAEGDLNKDGQLAPDELTFALKNLHLSMETAQAMVQGGDADMDGALSKSEYHCVSGHATTYYASAVRYLGSSLCFLASLVLPFCGYYGFQLMHDEFGGVGFSFRAYRWVMVPLGILAAGVGYASTSDMGQIVPFLMTYAGIAIFLLSFYGISGLLFTVYFFLTTFRWNKGKRA